MLQKSCELIQNTANTHAHWLLAHTLVASVFYLLQFKSTDFNCAHRHLQADPAIAAIVVVDVDHQVGRRSALNSTVLHIDAAAAWARIGDLRGSVDGSRLATHRAQANAYAALYVST